MRLLIVTQKVDQNDQNLGFFHRWIIEFAKHCESVIVICLEEGLHELPANVKVLSLGKEQHKSRGRYLLNFYRYIFQERKNYDAVFVHMNPIYVVLGGIVWKILGKKISLWYTHKSVDLKLRIAEKFVHRVFTASKESFRLDSRKVDVVGHGIDTSVFFPIKRDGNAVKVILSVSRISPTKNQLTMIEAIKYLKEQSIECELYIVGGAVTKIDEEYESMLKDLVIKKGLDDVVKFIGPISQRNTVRYYQASDIFLNLSKTGSLDKAVLEAMACGIIPLTTNEAFRDMLDPFGLFVTSGDVEAVAEQITHISSNPMRYTEIANQMRDIVVRDYDLSLLISDVVSKCK